LEKVLHKLKKGQLIALGGATATGKTQAAIQLSKHFGDCPIISCDARQFYREMSIGTAKPSPEELAAAPHYFINNLSVQQAYTVGDFRKEALNFLYKHFQTHPYAILVGGSGLFYRALCEGMDNFPDIDPQIRTHLESAYAEKGLDFLQAQIQALDPEYAQVMNEQTLQNPRRLLRALEVCVQTNSTYTQFLKTNARPRPNFDIFKLVLSWERKSLYQRIDQRVLDMFAQGLEEEARSLYPLRDLTALQTVGYQELFDYFEHKTSLPKARELIQQHTRNYAKRQETWFAKEPNAHFIQAPFSEELLIQTIQNALNTNP
jgi:tRNA dimethylallyltransferase